MGCGGLQITDEIKLTIAAIAALLLLNERGEYYPKLCSILVYPSAYVVNQTKPVSNYVVQETKVVRLGESWTRDRVVLSWEQIKYDTQNWKDGHNVILHEFAHQLDTESGTANGVPILEQESDYTLHGHNLRFCIPYIYQCEKSSDCNRAKYMLLGHWCLDKSIRN